MYQLMLPELEPPNGLLKLDYRNGSGDIIDTVKAPTHSRILLTCGTKSTLISGACIEGSVKIKTEITIE